MPIRGKGELWKRGISQELAISCESQEQAYELKEKYSESMEEGSENDLRAETKKN
jgi:hypothetical protein